MRWSRARTRTSRSPTALIANNGGQVTDEDIDQIENVCRCGTYSRIREAIKTAVATMNGSDNGTDNGNGNGSRGRPDDTLRR